jgi:predicted  nucleic acid-binding Zn-ribbon protein
MRPIVAVLTLLLLTISGNVLSRAQQEAPPADPSTALLHEVSALNRTLEDISALLSLLLDQQEVDILMKRMQFKERRLSGLESELQGKKNEAGYVQEEIQRLKSFREQLDLEEQSRSQSGLDDPDPDAERARRSLEAELSVLEEKATSLDRQIIELENDVGGLRDEFGILEEMLNERLDLR